MLGLCTMTDNDPIPATLQRMLANIPDARLRCQAMWAEWKAAESRTDPLDHDTIERGLGDLFDRCGLTRPTIHWAESPWHGCLIADRLGLDRSTGDLLLGRIWDELAKVIAQVETNAGSAVTDQNLETLQPEVHPDRHCDAADSAIEAAMMFMVAAHPLVNNRYHRRLARLSRSSWRGRPRWWASDPGPWARLHRGQASCQWWPLVYHWDDVPLPVFLLWCEHLGHDAPCLAASVRVLPACPAWWLGDGVAVLCERPVALHLDDSGRPHSLVGPSMTYRDGFHLHHLHGELVPARAITHGDTRALAALRRSRKATVRCFRDLQRWLGPILRRQEQDVY